ncbi:low-specificity L-threonine aldolase [Pullulanibacillus sp. KACC 23026]|uniref:low-specificity L-threonine aldolase n=1 Tax=Pullulanibacillus sp. KACC 23026 TaxID=3028315 RepID=UPI0023AF7253|nr:low-specificity L-threonine aldolase [Pullulanibacillus sp. KACC 23026]WEG13840.1 low-specificity L-threonine aldolase [Pullulanibacillus sp. KACC 23026]
MIDLRSDTVTKPTEEMRRAMYEAEVGDDVYGEDPTLNELEEMAADILGKEAALFVTSGTQGNQVAVLTHCRPGQEIILEENAHIYVYEGGAISALAGVQPKLVTGIHGSLQAEDVERAIRGEDIHEPETGLIAIENTHNRAGGSIIPLEDMKRVYTVAQQNGIPVHLDGARLFNAVVQSGHSAKEFARETTTVQICLSKGLGSPVGSLIAGDQAFINRARKWRKRLGGGLRQAGILAAAGLVSLTKMVDRLSEDHERAQRLARALAEVEGYEISNNVDTNIVMLDVSNTSLSAKQIVEEVKKEGVLASVFGPSTIRLTTHYDISDLDIDKAITVFQNLSRKLN